MRPTVRLITATACLASLAVGAVGASAGLSPVDLAAVSAYVAAHGERTAGGGGDGAVAGATPRATCGPESLPETGRQGRVPLADFESGRAAQGYTCNAEQVGQYGDVLDVSEAQARKAEPQVREVSGLTWPEASIPQNSIPVTIEGRKYLLEVDEYARNPMSYDPMSPVGAARVIDISDETKPKVVSNLRLEVHQPEARRDGQKDDPGAQYGVQGYAGHYCSVPQREEPGIVACSFILSGLRVFDIRNPHKPREIAYFNKPAPLGFPLKEGAYAMSAPAFAPAFAPERNEIWYSDGNSGFYNVRLTNSVWPKQK